ncbi:MAG TPA: alkaline phosphatase family protein [Solirubrobacteraceae bacterium]|nr:alkaline phosphatase family protein [Solirubrobacteraceae bacterium]
MRSTIGSKWDLPAPASRCRRTFTAGMLVAAVLVLVLALPGGPRAATSFRLPPVRHVFVIMLENENYASTFGDPSADPYLAKTLTGDGALLQDYYATGHESNDNYISIVAGQPPNADNQADCQIFSDFAGAVTLPNGVETGEGCVYPSGVNNIGTQLSAKGLNWKAYEEDMGNDPTREAAACGHPALNSQDHTQTAAPGDGYATRHDPFVYFHSVIDNQGYCDRHVVALGSPAGAMPAAALTGETGLATDLTQASTTPAFSFITPDLCDDGHDYPCTNEPSGASAPADIDRFLQTWVPKIMSSPAYRQNGLLEITFDESSSPNSDASSCCGEMPGPGSPLPGILGPGGGKVGAVLLSPYIKPGTVSATGYNHYSSLASWESMFGLSRLAYAADVPATFGADVFTAAPS